MPRTPKNTRHNRLAYAPTLAAVEAEASRPVDPALPLEQRYAAARLAKLFAHCAGRLDIRFDELEIGLACQGNQRPPGYEVEGSHVANLLQFEGELRLVDVPFGPYGAPADIPYVTLLVVLHEGPFENVQWLSGYIEIAGCVTGIGRSPLDAQLQVLLQHFYGLGAMHSCPLALDAPMGKHGQDAWRWGWRTGSDKTQLRSEALITIEGQIDEYMQRKSSPHAARRPSPLSGSVIRLGHRDIAVGYGREGWSFNTGELGWVLDAPDGLAFVTVGPIDSKATAEQILQNGAGPTTDIVERMWTTLGPIDPPHAPQSGVPPIDLAERWQPRRESAMELLMLQDDDDEA